MLSLFKDYPQLLRGRPGNPFFVFPAIFLYFPTIQLPVIVSSWRAVGAPAPLTLGLSLGFAVHLENVLSPRWWGTRSWSTPSGWCCWWRSTIFSSQLTLQWTSSSTHTRWHDSWHFDNGYDSFLNNEDIDDNDNAEEGDDDDAGEDQAISSAVNILLYSCKVTWLISMRAIRIALN